MKSTRHIAMIALLVRDYDEAIAWYRDALGFELLEDDDRGVDKRWVRMAPTGSSGFSLLLAKAATPEQQTSIGNQHSARVGFFLHTGDFDRDHARLSAAGARFEETPRHEEYGTVVVFRDLYGNRWDLIDPKERGRQKRKRLRLRGSGQLFRSLSLNSFGYSPQMIKKPDSKPLCLAHLVSTTHAPSEGKIE